MMRVRVRYTKRGRVRFVSARDMTSVWERALRRAELPIHYSEGFSPHPKVSFPDALPVGMSSTGEYAELTFSVPIEAGPALGRLSATLPEGMDITSFVVVPDGTKKLAAFLRATLWEVEFPATSPADATALTDDLDRRAAALLAADRVEVIRSRPKGDRTLDVRAPIHRLATTRRPSADGLITPALRTLLDNDGPSIRPNELLDGLASLADGDLPRPRRLRRVAQGEVRDDGLVEALTREHVMLVPEEHAEAA